VSERLRSEANSFLEQNPAVTGINKLKTVVLTFTLFPTRRFLSEQIAPFRLTAFVQQFKCSDSPRQEDVMVLVRCGEFEEVRSEDGLSSR
jgi:hypothetical protein